MFHVMQAVIVEGGMALLGALLALLCGLDLGKAFFVSDASELVAQLSLGVALSAALALIFYLLDYLPLSSLKEISKLTQQTLKDTLDTATRFNRFLICLLAGIGEEILFRGFIFIAIFEFWPWGLEYHLNIIAAIAISSFLFGLGHSVTPLYVVIAGLLGAAFSLVFLWTGSLIAPIVAHGLYDFYAIERALKE